MDLYQIAGSLTFTNGGYSIRLVEAGGGLGGPEDSYFISGETSPGQLDFAYTMKNYGAGAFGDTRLLVVTITANTEFDINDFGLLMDPGKLLARDSLKQTIPVHLEREVQQ